MHDLRSWVYGLGSFFIPLLVVFLSLSLFYRLAPRRPTQFAEVWAAALCATVLLQAAESLFVIYLKNFATLNAVYGAFGGIMALLLWIYLSGCIFIFGACLCAAQAKGRSAPAETNNGAHKRGELNHEDKNSFPGTAPQDVDAYWRAANYLSVGQIYLYDNPLLKRPL